MSDKNLKHSNAFVYGIAALAAMVCLGLSFMFVYATSLVPP